MSTSAAAPPPPAAAAAQDEILVTKQDTTRVITLNRPKALNALNLPMVRTMIPLLKAWHENDLVDKVILKGTGSKAFCAGGDVRAIAEAGQTGGSLPREFFHEEYQLNHLIGTFNKPIIAIINGITSELSSSSFFFFRRSFSHFLVWFGSFVLFMKQVGGGVGLSVHAPIRIATENTLFAMPGMGPLCRFSSYSVGIS